MRESWELSSTATDSAVTGARCPRTQGRAYLNEVIDINQDRKSEKKRYGEDLLLGRICLLQFFDDILQM
jgi:hypothetical protein